MLPISVGTVLQNRYRIIQTLGQGGFGRTYLAEDQRRFNELCAIKELITTGTADSSVEKAEELFLREAAILYQIQHPQIPQFRERFEQDQRLFLVQEYVGGKTYRDLLEERKAFGNGFQEAEVIQLMRSILPVLDHIHSRGIIHRDISPENIILRDNDGKPVLIDFGVVKEIATRLQTPGGTVQATAVGKIGYAPSEQMQTGRAYPNSDLYALAVTVVELLTAREPKDLFDDTQLTWNWLPLVRINPQFAAVLNRMLSFRPGDRYQSATGVLQALEALVQNSPDANLTNVQTVAVAPRQRPDLGQPLNSPENDPKQQKPPHRAIPAPTNNASVLDNPLAVGAIGSAVVILAGLGSWTIVSNMLNQRHSEENIPAPGQTFPSPLVSTPTPTSTPTVTPTATPTASVENKILNIAGNNTGTIGVNQTVKYNFFAQEGQKITALLEQEGINFTIFGPNKKPVDNAAKEVTFYESLLSASGQYTIQLTNPLGSSDRDYNLTVKLEGAQVPKPPVEKSVTPTSTEKPVISKPTEKPLIPTPTEKPVTPKPTPTATQTPTEQPTTEKPTTEKPVIPKPITEKPTIPKPAPTNSPFTKPPVDNSPAEKVPKDESTSPNNTEGQKNQPSGET